MEGTTGRPVVWATAQYLSYARPGTVMDIDVTVAVEGHQITQARAVGHVGNVEILTVNAALGGRPLEAAGQWAVMPDDVPPPEDCGPRPSSLPGRGVDQHPARPAHGEGPRLLGARRHAGRRPHGDVGPDARSARHVGRGARRSSATTCRSESGRRWGCSAGGNSLDNTLRVARLVPTDWVLLDIRVHAVANGFGHGLVHLWAQDGTLLGTASQSCILRFWKDREPPPTS